MFGRVTHEASWEDAFGDAVDDCRCSVQALFHFYLLKMGRQEEGGRGTYPGKENRIFLQRPALQHLLKTRREGH